MTPFLPTKQITLGVACSPNRVELRLGDSEDYGSGVLMLSPDEADRVAEEIRIAAKAARKLFRVKGNRHDWALWTVRNAGMKPAP